MTHAEKIAICFKEIREIVKMYNPEYETTGLDALINKLEAQ